MAPHISPAFSASWLQISCWWGGLDHDHEIRVLLYGGWHAKDSWFFDVTAVDACVWKLNHFGILDSEAFFLFEICPVPWCLHLSFDNMTDSNAVKPVLWYIADSGITHSHHQLRRKNDNGSLEAVQPHLVTTASGAVGRWGYVAVRQVAISPHQSASYSASNSLAVNDQAPSRSPNCSRGSPSCGLWILLLPLTASPRGVKKSETMIRWITWVLRMHDNTHGNAMGYNLIMFLSYNLCKFTRPWSPQVTNKQTWCKMPQRTAMP